jgi:hypothetical protein
MGLFMPTTRLQPDAFQFCIATGLQMPHPRSSHPEFRVRSGMLKLQRDHFVIDTEIFTRLGDERCVGGHGNLRVGKKSCRHGFCGEQVQLKSRCIELTHDRDKIAKAYQADFIGKLVDGVENGDLMGRRKRFEAT